MPPVPTAEAAAACICCLTTYATEAQKRCIFELDIVNVEQIQELKFDQPINYNSYNLLHRMLK
ncbi:hypothetical protein T07_8407 [Trichinella nelsoni]|uniref:Uncharacterized protein n=1 Tax=Trichinella nelsoni TaxID=6336 RepID=A0A0V0SJW0_9BILA|nr:hypothetical protein T07_8407 [Trichinella nelsoni]